MSNKTKEEDFNIEKELKQVRDELSRGLNKEYNTGYLHGLLNCNQAINEERVKSVGKNNQKIIEIEKLKIELQQKEAEIERLIVSIAQGHSDDKYANNAMKQLKERFDKTYMFCVDCDGLVTKEKDCCLTQKNK